MPKQIYNQSDFSGGINGIDSPRDVQDNQVIQAKSVAFDEKGRIRMSGKAVGGTTTSIDDSDLASGFESGTSFFHFSHDYNMLSSGAIDTSPSIQDEGVELFAVGAKDKIAIYDSIDNNWMKDVIDIGTDPGAGDRKAGFYFADAALRVYNQLLDSAVSPRWHGHIKRTLFEDSGQAIALNHWFTTTTKLLAPATGTYDNGSIGSETPGKYNGTDSDGGTVGSTADTLKINADDQGTGTWLAETYPIYMSYIYDGSQESQTTKILDMGIAVDKALYLAVTVDYTLSSSQSQNFNSRITGARVYYSDPTDGDGIKYHLMDISLEKGCKKFNETEYTDWNHEGSYVYECPNTVIGKDADDTNDQPSFFKFEDMPKTVTYDMLNGYSASEVTDAEFKCHTIFNNRVYVGNIQQDGNTYPDRIIRSPINFEGNPQYDTFPATHKMDVAANDGDQITALEGFGDRLLIFKRKSVYVVNIAQDGTEFVETKFTDLGVLGPSQVVETEYGICWINSKGLYIYRENQAINLVEQLLSPYSGRRITPNMRWNVDSSKSPAITYIPTAKKLLISLGFADNYSNDGWIYDFVKKSLSFVGGALGNWAYKRSNFITDSSGIPHFAQLNGNVLSTLRWEDEQQSNTEFSLFFKDLDFGQPNVRKKIYKAYLSFRSKGVTNVLATYCTDGNYGEALAFSTTPASVGSGGELVETSSGTSELVSEGAYKNPHVAETLAQANADQIGSLNLYAHIAQNSAILEILNQKLRVTNDPDSDIVVYHPITVATSSTYRVDITYFRWVPGSDAVSNKVAPTIMAWVADTFSTHAEAIHDDNDLAHIIIGSSGTHSFEFTSASDTSLAICFRAVEYDGSGDLELFNNYQKATTDSYNRFDLTSVKCSKESEWTRAELKPNTSSEANNVYSFGLKLNVETGNTVPSEFEIDNLSVVYRNKNIK